MRVRKVLVVDDDPEVQELSRFSLSELGAWAVSAADSGRAAVDAAAREQPDVILLDVVMPEVDGPAAFRSLKAEPSTRRIPVIFLTGLGDDDRIRALGAAGVIAKPFDPLALEQQILGILERRGA